MPMATKEQQREYQRQWMAERRQDWIDSQGGCCVECGSTDRLEVDHIDPSLKTIKPSQLWSRRQETRDKELVNCQVLCYDCHKKKTKITYINKRQHGTSTMWAARCKCSVCKNYHRLYMKEWRNKNK